MLSRDSRDSGVSAEVNPRIEAEVPEVRGHRVQLQAETETRVRAEIRDVLDYPGDLRLWIKME